MGIGPSQRAGICDGFRKLVESGRLPQEALALVELAEKEKTGDAAFRQLVGLLSEVRPLDSSVKPLSHWVPSRIFAALAQPGDSETKVHGVLDIQFMPKVVERLATQRAMEVFLGPYAGIREYPDSYVTIQELEEYVFREIKYGRKMVPADPSDGATIEYKVRSILAARLCRMIVSSLTISDKKAVGIPSAPYTNAFWSEIGHALGAEDPVVEALVAWEVGWNMLLLRLFAVLLARGQDTGQHASIADGMDATIAKRRTWFNELISLGFTVPNMQKEIEHVFRDPNSPERIRAVSELFRFTSKIDCKDLDSRRAAVFLASEIHLLHGLAPMMDGEKFLSFLPKIASSMTFDSAHEALNRARPSMRAHDLYSIYMKLCWHAAEPELFLEELEKLIKHYARFKTLDSLAKDRLGVNSKTLYAKIEQLKAQGMDVNPVMDVIAEKFPEPQAEEAPMIAGLQPVSQFTTGVPVFEGAQLMLPFPAPKILR